MSNVLSFLLQEVFRATRLSFYVAAVASLMVPGMESFSNEELDQAQEESIFEDPSAETSSSPSSHDVNDINDINRHAPISPKIGDRYQVEIPNLNTEFDNVEVQENATSLPFPADNNFSDHVGLAIPITWVSSLGGCIHPEPVHHGDAISKTTGEFSLSKSNVCSESIAGENLDDFGVAQITIGRHQNDEISTNNGNLEGQVYAVPDKASELWTKLEQDSFLLGLYIFGKKFTQVKRFVESKDMKNILLFYYGKFYGSSRYKRWRKARGKRHIEGQRLISGWRQQEIISRLLAQVPEEVGISLVEVSKMFIEERLPLEQYVASLKNTVGLPLLFDAFAIGKGKLDLSRMPIEPTKMNQIFSTRPEIPIGKACSTLSSVDIIKFLTGDFRLSKAKSNDLFWEAVWPRLLARGWQSEQPKKQGYVNPRHSLVFLIPGVKKFSRRKLVKGIHYFDSISDVLNKIASEPELLELELEAVNGRKCAKDGFGEGAGVKMEKLHSLNNGHHHYLQPRTSSSNRDLLKFTVVDTSMADGEPRKVRELRTLPSDKININCRASPPRETDSDSSPAPLNDVVNSSDQEEQMIEQREKTKSNSQVLLDDDLSHEDDDLNASPLTLSQKNTKIGVRVGIRYLTPITKRRRLNACDELDRNRINSNTRQDRQEVKEDDAGSMLGFHKAKMVIVSEKETSDQKIFSPPSSKDNKVRVDYSFGETELLAGKSEPLELIDLNLPHFPPDFETAEACMSDVDDGKDVNITKDAGIPLETHFKSHKSESMGRSTGVGGTDGALANARRQSTRSRPLTTRALEAIECGFLTAKKRVSGKKGVCQDNSSHRSRPRVRRTEVSNKTSHSEKIDVNVVDLSNGGVADEHNSNTIIDFRGPQDPPEGNPEHEVLDE